MRRMSLAEYLARTGSSGPKYARLRRALTEAIDEGLWSAGHQLPTEQDLAQLTPFSLGTVQRAIKALVEEGRVVRVKGQGTFVAEKPRGIAQPFLHARFLDDSGQAFLPVYPKVVSKKLVTERGPWSQLLKQRGRDIFRVERILRIDEEFAVFSRFFVNAGQFPGFTRKSTEELTSGNYKLMLSREFNLPPISYEQVMEFTSLAPRIARALGLGEGAIGAIFRVIAMTAPRIPVYYHEVYVPPNHRQLRLPDMVLPTGR